MSTGRQLSVVVSTYQRPEHLRRSLLSLAVQRGVEGQFEIVVTDDGSDDGTAQVVQRFAKSVDFPVRFVTQQHRGFRAARCRNNGVTASEAPYLIFCDGDCIFPFNYLLHHLRVRRSGVAWSGISYRLDAETSCRIDEEAIASGTFADGVPAKKRRQMNWRWIKDEFYYAIRHPYKPRLLAGNFAVWRRDFERVNGFDERFVGWGCEDDDLNKRLRRAGVRLASILRYTRPFHLWHPHAPSQPERWRDGANVAYLLRSDKPIRCVEGFSTGKEEIQQVATAGTDGLASWSIRREPAPDAQRPAA